MEKINSELKELVLTQKEIEDYIRKGKTQFLLQVLIIVGLFVVSVFCTFRTQSCENNI